ncbi:MAG: hypothetical protein RIQ33_1990 [Bacteroidota bacterium]|jgi:uncharacterized damage-inducible protein DinB
MYRKVTDFITDWGYESQSTIKLFNEINQAAMTKPLFDGGRTLGQLAWHIAETLPEMIGQIGIEFNHVHHDKWDEETSIQQIIHLYQTNTTTLLTQLKNWNDTDLELEDNMYGENWKRGTTLEILIKHQAHHRGQLTLAMRQMGMKVPGMYGPAKHEWAEFGMTPLN